MQDSRRRIWLQTGKRRFGTLAEMNAWLAERCCALWQEIRHPEHQAFSVAEMLEHASNAPMPMPAPYDGCFQRTARVWGTCPVAVARNRCSVPCELAGQRVSTRPYPTRVKVAAGEAIVADHERLTDEGKAHYDWQHYIPLMQRKLDTLPARPPVHILANRRTRSGMSLQAVTRCGGAGLNSQQGSTRTR